jgi:hypothetical protein
MDCDYAAPLPVPPAATARLAVGTAGLRFWRNGGARAAAREHVEAVEMIEDRQSRAES